VERLKIAFVLFDGITFLDLIGFYDVIYRVNLFPGGQGTTWDFCGLKEEVTDELGLRVKVNRVAPDLSEYDMLYVPGGMGTRKLKDDPAFVEWLGTAKDVPLKVSVCTGSLLMGAAGFLRDRKATSNPNTYDLLEPYCQEVVKARIVKDGNVMTGGAVATAIDLGIYVAEMIVGKEAAEAIKKQIDYPYQAEGIVEVNR
jgi:cyclohexyl-isocyanide hydratase